MGPVIRRLLASLVKRIARGDIPISGSEAQDNDVYVIAVEGVPAGNTRYTVIKSISGNMDFPWFRRHSSAYC